MVRVRVRVKVKARSRVGVRDDLGALVRVLAVGEAHELHGKVRRQPRDLPLHLVRVGVGVGVRARFS